MDTKPPRTSAYLLLLGLALSLVGTLMDDTWAAGAVLLAGFVTVLTALARWARRGRRSGSALGSGRTHAAV